MSVIAKNSLIFNYAEILTRVMYTHYILKTLGLAQDTSIKNLNCWGYLPLGPKKLAVIAHSRGGLVSNDG